MRLTVYPDDGDAFGHLNQASFLTLFERARRDALAAGPGVDVFPRHGVWPAVRKATIGYFQRVFPGQRLRFELDLTHQGRTSFGLRQVARKRDAEAPAATAELLFVRIGGPAGWRRRRSVATSGRGRRARAARRR